jgi:hypothetical protein
LTQKINGRTLLERLELAFMVPPSDPNTQLVFCDDNNRGVTFGFVDSIVHTGALLFCSLLKYRASRELTDLFTLVKQKSKAACYSDLADNLKQQIDLVFTLQNGLPLASTGVSCQPDVWAAAFGVYIDAFTTDKALAIGQALRESYFNGTLAYHGNIRHIRTCDDFNESTAWERCVNPGSFSKNKYQNGAYWNTPTGWVCYAISHIDMDAAVRLAEEYIDELRTEDFRKGSTFGSPWECIHPDGNYKQNAVYMTSVTCPLAAFYRLGWGKGGKEIIRK